MENQIILITIPHEKCDASIEGHFCDYLAATFANKLEEIMNDGKRLILTFHGDINRKIHDLNRRESRLSTVYRMKFRSAVLNILHRDVLARLSTQDKFNRVIYLIDCHSFPNDSKSFGDEFTPKPEIAILYDRLEDIFYADELEQMLRNKNIPTNVHPGYKNDLMDEMIEAEILYELNKYNIKIIPLLVEIREDLTKEKIATIAETINEFTRRTSLY